MFTIGNPFSTRPVSSREKSYREAMIMLENMSDRDRADAGIKQSDIRNIASAMAHG
jgi:uncharacterized protein YjiS (DUF1127 family)